MISPAAGGGGATVTLSGAVNVTTTADSTGTYTFSKLTNGTYVVAPSNPGFAFSPVSQSVAISGANLSGVNFTAQALPPAVPGAPVLFFSDLISGPATGNSDSTHAANGGVYVTLYGNFLTNPTVTLNGANCLVLVSQPSAWLWYQRMTVQLTSTCSTGSFIVTTSIGSSNALPFTVRSGEVFYVAKSGSDSNSGSFASPWLTPVHAVQTAGTSPGNTIYLENGVIDTVDDGQGWGGAITFRSDWCHGTQVAPDALAAYPGATATIGAVAGGASMALSTTDSTASGGACAGSWTFAELVLRGPTVGLLRGPSNNWRIIGTDISNDAQTGSDGGAFETIQAANNKILGNNFHDLNVGSHNRLTQGLYLSTDSNHSEVAWNVINNSGGRAGLQVHSSPLCIPACGTADTTGSIMFDILIHDNMFSNIGEEAVIMDTEDPSKGSIAAYNNVIWNACQDGISCDGWIYHPMSGDFNQDNGVGAGTAHDFNNTIYCTSHGPCWGSTFEVHASQALIYDVQNNLIYSGGPSYWIPGRSSDNATCGSGDSAATCPNFAGSNNLVFGAGAATFTNILSGTLNVAPLFVNPAAANFSLPAGSPANRAGVAIPGLIYDIQGKPRPNPPSVGAYEP